MIEGRSLAARGFLFPKKAEGLARRDVGLTLAADLGLDLALEASFGLNETAAGFGLNSMALTLNLEDVADRGVGAPLDL